MSSIGSSLSGVQSAMAQFQTAASNIANPNSGSDFTGDIVDAVTAQASVSINLQMIKSEQKMTKALIDIFV